MSWQLLATELRAVPWSSFAWCGATAVVALIVWQLTKRHYKLEWLRFAPEKARDVVREAARRIAAVEEENRQLRAEAAELRGMVEGVKARLERPLWLDTVENARRKA